MRRKVKIVQIAMIPLVSGDAVNTETDIYTEYLDSNGRVWTQKSRTRAVKPTLENDFRSHESYYEWEQIEMPEEPSV